MSDEGFRSSEFRNVSVFQERKIEELPTKIYIVQNSHFSETGKKVAREVLFLCGN